MNTLLASLIRAVFEGASRMSLMLTKPDDMSSIPRTYKVEGEN